MPESYRSNRQVDFSEILRGIRASRFSPHPPAGVRITGGVLYWEFPQDSRGITHWRIYSGNDSNTALIREVPAGQTTFGDGAPATRVFVSSWSQPYEKESRRVLASDVSGSGLTGTSGAFVVPTFSFVLSSPATTINVATTISDGKFIVVQIAQDATGGRLVSFDGAQFHNGTPANVNRKPLAETFYTFIGVGGKWQCLSVFNRPV